MNNEEMLKQEISFMYAKYTELCEIYKKLVLNTQKNVKPSVTDQSQMDFTY